MSISNASMGMAPKAHSASASPAVTPAQGITGITKFHHHQTPGFAERPLVLMQRAPSKLVRAPDEAGVLTRSARPEDRYGVISPPGEELSERRVSPGDTSPAAAANSEVTDVEEIAEQTWRMMAERLLIERERRGLAEWA